MPSTLTHYIFNKKIIKDEKYADIFLLGGQGADVFFFYGYNIVKRKNIKEIRQIGANIHQINPDKLYMSMLSYAFSKNGEEKEILINYIRGFMYHYALDRLIHPYVFYNTGFPYTNKKYNYYHGKFESILDTLLAKENDCNISTRKSIKTKKHHVKICSEMISTVVNDYFNINLLKENSFYNAYKDFRFVRLIIDSKYGIKKALFETFLKESTINAICQPKKVDDEYDYMNIQHNIWIDPSSGDSKTESVNDMFYNAYLDCRIIDNIIYNFKDNVVTQRKITKFTNNINHDGRCLDKFMTYFKIIWKDEK